jgi:hypothetical protein|tara:strand:- start:775 stop:963 length:189 start_codon:yes stop_codon:yes gene_type:complete
MIKALKSKLLTYLFTDWVKTETDIETLQLSAKFIKKREIEITGIKPVMGFRSYAAEEQQING